MNYFLFDFTVPEDYLKKEFDAVCIGSKKTSPPIIGWLRSCFDVLSRANENDIIICWYDFQAVLIWWLITILHKKTNKGIFCINLLLKDKPTLKNRATSFLYKRALLSPNFHASVTSVNYGKWLNNKLNIECKYQLLHDIYVEDWKCKHDIATIKNSVFCGGCNGRDWDFLIQLAQKLPNVRFIVVMQEVVYKRYESRFPANMEIECDISFSDFIERLCAAEMEVLPLDTDAPAGLQVIYQAAANGKMVITTKTATTVEYINNENGEALPRDVGIWSEKIKFYLEHLDISYKKAEKLRVFLSTECSAKKYYETINKMIESQ